MHFNNWTLLNDGRILDPDYPESLVYRVTDDGERVLEAAMYMLEEGDTLDDVPELGGPLTQWHIHNDLCYTPDPVAPKVRGLREPGGDCNPPLVAGKEVPMIHVWIVPHECGPFSALDGIGAGAIQGYFGGWIDLVFQRVIEVWTAIPSLYLLLIIASVLAPSFWVLLGILLLFSWVALVGVVRAEFLRGRNFEYIAAARALGVSNATIMRRHLLPNAMVATLTFMPAFVYDGILIGTTLVGLFQGLVILLLVILDDTFQWQR